MSDEKGSALRALDFSMIAEARENGRSMEEHAAGLERLRGALRSGASPNVPGARGQTPLGYACSIGALAAARELLAHGALMSTSRPEELSPLVHASLNGHSEVVKLLLERGAAVNEHPGRLGTTSVGLTALHAAAASGSRACAEALLQAGADPKAIIGWNQMTPLDAAKHNGNDEVADFISAFELALGERMALEAAQVDNCEKKKQGMRL